MIRVLVEGDEVAVPGWVNDVESFRRWTDGDDFPEKRWASYLRGEITVDLNKEQLFTHVEVKTEISAVLSQLVHAGKTGHFFTSGIFVSSNKADYCTKPDGTYVSIEALDEGRVRYLEGKDRGYVEVEGSPDMILEIVSNSSMQRDTKLLREAYAVAGIREYWLVDARKEPWRFDLLRLSRGRYVAARKTGGWSRSAVFDRWFRLRQEEGPDGFPQALLDTSTENPT